MRTLHSPVSGMASSLVAHDGAAPSVGHVVIDTLLWAAGAAAVVVGILVLLWGLRKAGDRLQRR